MATPFSRLTTLADRLPIQSHTLFEAKASKKMSFEDIAKQLGRNEVAVAAIFYGQAQTTPEDVEKLSSILGIEHSQLEKQLAGFPFRGQTMDMPPKEPLIYRLYEIVQNYGYAYKAILNEKFGDGIMSAIAFSTKVEKETDKDGNNWAVITLRGKCPGQPRSFFIQTHQNKTSPASLVPANGHIFPYESLTLCSAYDLSTPRKERSQRTRPSTCRSSSPLLKLKVIPAVKAILEPSPAFETDSNMGQTQSKRSSAGSTEPLTSTSQNFDTLESTSEITKPDPPRHLHHLSELIDLNELFNSPCNAPTSIADMHTSIDAESARPKAPARARTIIQSPSGQELDAYQYMSRPDRPLTMQERQARITERLEQESRLEGERRREYLRMMQATEETEKHKRSRRKGCCGGWLCG